MDTSIVIALTTSTTSLTVAVTSLVVQRRTARAAQQAQMRSEAKHVLDRYRGPLLSAAAELGDRIDNIRHREFLALVEDGGDRARTVKLTTMFRFAQYFGWRELLRTDVQLLRFENEADTRLAASLIGDIVWSLASDAQDEGAQALWSEEQRAIGELMLGSSEDGSIRCRGYAAFVRDYPDHFKRWMSPFGDPLLSRSAPSSNQLRLLQWALCGLVQQLDEEGAHGERMWMHRVRSEISAPHAAGEQTRLETQIRADLARVAIGRR